MLITRPRTSTCIFLLTLACVMAGCSKGTDPSNGNNGGGPTPPTRDQIVGIWRQAITQDLSITTSSQQTVLASWLPGTGQISFTGSLAGALTYLRRYKYTDSGDTFEVLEATEKPQNDTGCQYFLHLEKNGQQYSAYFEYTPNAGNSIFFDAQAATGITDDPATVSVTLNAMVVYNWDDPSDSLVFNGTLRSAEMAIAAGTKTKLVSWLANTNNQTYETFNADSSYTWAIYFPPDFSDNDSSWGTWTYANGIVTVNAISVEQSGDTIRDTGSFSPTVQNNATVMSYTLPSVDYCVYCAIEYNNYAECLDRLEYEYGLDAGALTQASITTHVTDTRVAAVTPKAAAMPSLNTIDVQGEPGTVRRGCVGGRRLRR